MTDAELRDKAVAALKETTASYPNWVERKDRGVYPDITKTKWWQALDYLGKIGVEPPPEPVVVAAPGSTGQPIHNVGYSDGILLNIQTNGATYADYAMDAGGGDSSVLIGSGGNFKHGVTLQRMRMRQVASGNKVSYGKHGVYCDAYDVTMEDMDIQCSNRAANGISVRLGGTHVNRTRISGASFVFGFFDSDTGQSGAECLLENVIGSNAADTCIWCDAQDDFKTTFDMKLRFRNVHLTGSPAFLKASRVRNGTFAFEGCTLNGQPLTKAGLPNVPNVTIS